MQNKDTRVSGDGLSRKDFEKLERIEFLKSRIQALKNDIAIFGACSEDLQKLYKLSNELKELETNQPTTS